MRVAIVHDYLAQAGGAERVVEAMHDVFPDAPIFTSVYDPEHTLPSFKTMDIRTSFLQKWAKDSRIHKFALPFYPAAFEQFDMTGFDIVLSSTTGFAKGVITGPDTCHICYCHTPARFAWRYHEYIAQGGYGRATQQILPFLIHRLRAWDYASAQRVDYFLVNSHNVARRVRKFYGKTSEVLHPPVTTNRFAVLPSPTADYLLVVSRLVGYKRVDIAVEACARLGIPLKVVGTGPDLPRLKQMAGPQVEFLGRLSDGAVADLLANCRAFLFPGEEDFGIAPLEAMASGRPVIAYGAGGALETVVDGVTGLHFCYATAESLMDAIQRLDGLDLDPARIRAHAARFDVSEFRKTLKETVERCVALHHAAYSHVSPGHGPFPGPRAVVLSNGSSGGVPGGNGNGKGHYSIGGNGGGAMTAPPLPVAEEPVPFPDPD
ncbi:MAG: glycosyltransferase [Cytophagales bacterium]|nr:glycosyltransferase [Armatimonadota bacterium]